MGAAGVYASRLTQDAGITTLLTITPGQTVSVNGDSDLTPSWGSGGFTVESRGSLALSNVALGADLAVLSGGTVILQSTTLGDSFTVAGTATLQSSTLSGSLSVTGDGTASLTACTLSKTNVITSGHATLSMATMHLPRSFRSGCADCTVQLSAVNMSGSSTLLGGTVTLQASTLSGSLHVASGSASLIGCTLNSTFRIMTDGASSVSMSTMDLPSFESVSAGSTVQLTAVTMMGHGHLMGTLAVAQNGELNLQGLRSTGPSPTFTVMSGDPCEVSQAGRCVGYYTSPSTTRRNPEAHCAITVAGGGGVVGVCPKYSFGTGMTLVVPGGRYQSGSPRSGIDCRDGACLADCPTGSVLSDGDNLTWDVPEQAPWAAWNVHVTKPEWEICFV